MGERGHTIHVLDGQAAETLAGVGHRVAVLGRNARWTSWVPLGAPDFDCQEASKVLKRVILQAWFDDDLGVVAQVYAKGKLVGELTLPGEPDGAAVSKADRDLLETLETLEVLDPVQRALLLQKMADPSGMTAWAMAHGFEQLLGLPFYDPIPTGLPEPELLELLPSGATLLEPPKAKKATKARKTTKPKASAPAVPAKTKWSKQEKATLALHQEYWGSVFSMNNWKLYQRYKKHLPADQRRDVDQLCNAIAKGEDDEVKDRVTSILARIWTCEDWDAVIRDPKLEDGDDDVWAAWAARVCG